MIRLFEVPVYICGLYYRYRVLRAWYVDIPPWFLAVDGRLLLDGFAVTAGVSRHIEKV